MVRLNGLLKKSTIKTSFNEVTVADLLKIVRHTPREVLAALSDIPPDKLSGLSSEDVLALYELVAFVEDLGEVALCLRPDVELPEVDVAGATFEKLELAKKRTLEIKQPYRLFIELVKIYFGEGLLAGPAVPCLALGAWIYQDLNLFFERFKDLGAEPPTEEEEEAGIEALHSFGPYGIAENLAAKYGAKPFEVFQWSAEEVYLELTYQLAKNRYQDNLREIEKRKNVKPKK